MKDSDFKALQARAAELYASQGRTDKNKISLDAIFIALSSEKAAPAKVRKVTEDAPPEWFTQTLERLRGTGEKINVGRFLLLAGQFPAKRSDSLAVGRWLREAGYTPQKTGGNVLFEL